MLRRLAIMTMVFAIFAGAAAARAEVDVPWAWIYQQEIEKTVASITQMLTPFSADSGFPAKRPGELTGKTWEATYTAAAQASGRAAPFMRDMLAKFKPNVRLRLGALYFQTRLEMGARIPAGVAGNDKAFEFLCREFATECKRGLDELSYWKSAEAMLTFDNLWAPKIREGLARVKAQMPVLPATVAPAQAAGIWKTAAKAAALAANEAGMTASHVGGFQFPAFRLHFAVKSSKAILKAAVIEYWDATRTPGTDWVMACERLRKATEQCHAQIDELLASLP